MTLEFNFLIYKFISFIQLVIESLLWAMIRAGYQSLNKTSKVCDSLGFTFKSESHRHKQTKTPKVTSTVRN